MAPHAVLKHWHPMVGLDWHIPWPPGAPSPAPSPVPYKTFAIMIGSQPKSFHGESVAVTSSPAKSHWSMGAGMSMKIPTDIGPMIIHIGPPSVTLPVEMVFSASKSHFGSSKYPVEKKPIAAALLIHVNPNLNCGNPLPTPTGFVIALNTHYVGMTWKDVFGGVGAMLGDFIVQALLQKLGNALGNRLANFLQPRLYQRFFGDFAIRALLRGGHPDLALSWAGLMAAAAAERRGNIAGAALGTVLGFLIGSPMGVDIGVLGGYNLNRDDPRTPGGQAGDLGSGAGRSLGERAGDALENYLKEPTIDDANDLVPPPSDNVPV